MVIYLTILRIIHIGSAVFWAGSSLFFETIFQPSIKGTDQAGTTVMQYVSQKSPYSMLMGITASLTVISGALLYWPISGGLSMAFMTSVRGIMLGLGAVAGIIAWVIGISMQRPAAARMSALGKEIASAGGPPSPEQLAEIAGLRAKLETGSRYTAILVAIAVLGMAAAQTMPG
jgi:uncharacterized membrane protein